MPCNIEVDPRSCTLPKLIVPFVFLEVLGGHVALPVAVLTLLWSKYREPSKYTSYIWNLINVLVIVMISSVFNCLLWYTGNIGHTRPPFTLCLVQAASTQASPPTIGIATLSIIAEVWTPFLSNSWYGSLKNSPRYIRPVLILVPPYLTFVVVCIVTVNYGMKHPETVMASSGLFCSLEAPAFKLAIPISSVVFTSVLSIMEVGMIYRYVTISRRTPLKQGKQHIMNLQLRILLFNVSTLIALIGSIVLIVDETNPFPFIALACLPLFTAVIFGARTSVIQTLHFWRPRPHDEQELQNLSAPLTTHIGMLADNITPAQSLV